MWLSRILDDIGIGRFHVLQNVLLGGIMLADGSEILVSSSVIGALRDEWNLSPLLRGSMMSIVFVGVMFGGLVGGFVADSHGRRIVVMQAYVGIICFGCCTAATSGPLSMLLFRFLLGVSFGSGMGPAIALVVESAHTMGRAYLVNFTNVWFTLGQLYASIVLIFFMPDLTDQTDWAWREVVFLAAVPSLLLLPFTYWLLQESPHFLLQKGRRSEALAVLKHMATLNGKPNVVNEVAEQQRSGSEAGHLLGRGPYKSYNSTAGSNPQGGDAVVAKDDPLAESFEEEGKNMMERLGIALSPEFRWITLGGCYLCFLSNFLFYGLNYALPQVFQRISTSINMEFSPATEILIATFMDLPGILVTFAFLHSSSMGHRDGMFALIACATPLQLAMVGLDGGPDMLRIAFGATYMSKLVVASTFALAYIYLGEVFPQACRCTAFSLCVAAGRVASILAPLAFEMSIQLAPRGNRHCMFFILNAVLCVMGLVVVRVCLVYELKNAPLEPTVVAKVHAAEARTHSKESAGQLARSPRPEEAS
mmetsp:Transcript_15660/g.36694  ORF Transcript_15660/g.36694 Transcript_15660/m.36694 type:complete len:535 (-) Transcript_15660:106-1710(-)